jgi:hypothetical protein
MEFTQSQYSTKTSFNFTPQGLSYFCKDRSASRNNFIKYDEFFLNQMFTMTERNEYFRNVGYIWLMLGIVLSITSHSVNFWLYLGIICLAIYYFVSTKYTVIPTAQANVLVLADKKHDAIIEILTKRVHQSIMEDIGSISFENSFENERKKYVSLLEAGIIGESQFNDYCQSMETNKEKFKAE